MRKSFAEWLRESKEDGGCQLCILRWGEEEGPIDIEREMAKANEPAGEEERIAREAERDINPGGVATFRNEPPGILSVCLFHDYEDQEIWGLSRESHALSDFLMHFCVHDIVHSDTTTDIVRTRTYEISFDIEAGNITDGTAKVYAVAVASGEVRGVIDRYQSVRAESKGIALGIGAPYEISQVGPSPQNLAHGEDAAVEFYVRVHTTAAGAVAITDGTDRIQRSLLGRLRGSEQPRFVQVGTVARRHADCTSSRSEQLVFGPWDYELEVKLKGEGQGPQTGTLEERAALSKPREGSAPCQDAAAGDQEVCGCTPDPDSQVAALSSDPAEPEVDREPADTIQDLSELERYIEEVRLARLDFEGRLGWGAALNTLIDYFEREGVDARGLAKNWANNSVYMAWKGGRRSPDKFLEDHQSYLGESLNAARSRGISAEELHYLRDGMDDLRIRIQRMRKGYFLCYLPALARQARHLGQGDKANHYREQAGTCANRIQQAKASDAFAPITRIDLSQDDGETR